MLIPLSELTHTCRGAPAPGSLLAIERITSSYDGLPTIRDLSLTVDAGKIVAVLGANGAGKSTLLKTIAGMMQADRGTITLGERRIEALKLREISRADVALVPEGCELFARLILDGLIMR